jgi:hypothetical protein
MAQELPSALEIKLWQRSNQWLRKRAESSALVLDYVKLQVRSAKTPKDSYAQGVLTTLRQARQPVPAAAVAAPAPVPAAHTAANTAAAAVVSSRNSSDGAARGKQRPTSRAVVKVKVLAYDP